MATDTSQTGPRPQRADARRNREKVVAAARAAFAETGLETQMEDIARRAGVGVGTLYRHFPTKDALVRGIVEAHMGLMAERGQELLDDPDADPWESFAGFLRECSCTHLHDRALAQVMSHQPASTFHEAAESSGLRATTRELLTRAQRAGRARPDARAEDVGVMMCGLGAVLHSWGEPAADRYVGLMLDGFCAAGGDPLPD